METNKLTWATMDIKTLLILILGGILIFNIIFGGSKDKTTDNTIKELEAVNMLLKKQNDSLKNESVKIIKVVDSLKVRINENKTIVDEAEKIKNDLNDKRNEIPNYVNRLSADDVANEFTKYLEARDKSNNVR